MWSKILPYLKHLFFLIAIVIVIGSAAMLIPIWNIEESKWDWENNIDSLIAPLTIFFVIIFFLWKSNYFTRNK